MSMIISLHSYWDGRWSLIAGVGSINGTYLYLDPKLHLLLLKNDPENAAKGIYEIALIYLDVSSPELIKSWKIKKNDEKQRSDIINTFAKYTSYDQTLFLKGTVLDENSLINLYSYIVAGDEGGKYNLEKIKKFQGRSYDRITAERKGTIGLDKSDYKGPLSISEAKTLVKIQLQPQNYEDELNTLFCGYRSQETPGNSDLNFPPNLLQKYICSLLNTEDTEVFSSYKDRIIIAFGRPAAMNPTLYCIAYELTLTNSKKVTVKMVELNPFTPKVLKKFSCAKDESKREIESAKIKNWLSKYTKFEFPTFFVINENFTDSDDLSEAVLENLPKGKANMQIAQKYLHNQIQRTKEMYLRKPQEDDETYLSHEEIKEYININKDNTISVEGLLALYDTWRLSATFNSKPIALSLDELRSNITQQLFSPLNIEHI